MTVELTAANCADYARAHGLLAPGEAARVRELSGGVSNAVLLVEGGSRSFVVKQAYPVLRTAEEWRADRARALQEAAALEQLRWVAPNHVPRVLMVDAANFAFAMSAASPEAHPWKDDLLAGRVNPAVAEQAGRFLATIHRATGGDSEVAERFGAPHFFVELRVDPYHYAAARRHPRLAAAIHAEAERLLATHRCLVSGDYSPKNMLVTADGGFIVVDWEVAHYGDPVFDLAFCLNHLLLKALWNPAKAGEYLGAARTFWRAYEEGAPEEPERLQRDAVRELGCLLLARVDGKSPVEYITDEPTKEAVRRLAAELLLGSAARLEDAIEAAQGCAERAVHGL